MKNLHIYLSTLDDCTGDNFWRILRWFTVTSIRLIRFGNRTVNAITLWITFKSGRCCCTHRKLCVKNVFQSGLCIFLMKTHSCPKQNSLSTTFLSAKKVCLRLHRNFSPSHYWKRFCSETDLSFITFAVALEYLQNTCYSTCTTYNTSVTLIPFIHVCMCLWETLTIFFPKLRLINN